MEELVLGEASIQENFLQDKKEMGDASKTGTTLFFRKCRLCIEKPLLDIYPGGVPRFKVFGGSSCCDLSAINTGDACVDNVDGQVRAKTFALSNTSPRLPIKGSFRYTR